MNMSYCRFRNTLIDLSDCENELFNTDDLSPEETQAREQLIDICRQITEMTDDE